MSPSTFSFLPAGFDYEDLAGSLGCDLADAWEVAVAARLVEVLEPDDARLAYMRIRDLVRDLQDVGASSHPNGM